MRSHPFATHSRVTAVATLAMLGGSLVAVATAPVLMPDSYSWVEHSVSESAAQGVEGAWLARIGFLLLGFGVLVLVGAAGGRWGRWGRVAHRTYGVAMIAVAAFSHAPWEPGPADAFEDWLHSAVAFVVGVAFAAGVLLVMIRRPPEASLSRAFDVLAVAAAVVIPMTMFNVDGIAGVVQRLMFGIGYAWYGSEAARCLLAKPPLAVAPVEPYAVLAGRRR